MAKFRTGKIWGLNDDSDVGSTLGVAFAASLNNGPRFAVTIDGPTDLVCTATVSGVAATAVEFRVDVSFGNGDFRALPADLVSVAPNPINGALADYTLIIHVPWSCEARLMARRVDGAAGTLLNVVGDARDASGGSLLSGLTGGSAPVVGPAQVAFDDGAGAPQTLTNNIQWGDWLEVGNANQIDLFALKTTANVPVDVFIAVEVSRDPAGVVAAFPTQIDQVAAGDVFRSGSEQRITDFTAAVNNRELLVEGIPQGSFVRFGPYFLGGAAPDLEIIAYMVEAT